MTRDPLVRTFMFAFPIVTMLIIGGPFGTRPDPAFEDVNPPRAGPWRPISPW